MSVNRQLPVRDGYTQVPSDLAFSSLPDLSVVVWAALRLAHDDQPHVVNYQDLAETLGMTALSARALQGRLTPAIATLAAAGWLNRTRGANNRYTYAAVKPADASKRYAQLRRCDLALLRIKPLREAELITPTQLVDFCRWQLECGQRGWTAENVVNLAKRWNLSERQFRNRRARLVACKLSLIVVTARTGHADLVWLGELHDPHWQVRTELDTEQRRHGLERAEIDHHSTPATSGVSDGQTAPDTPAISGVSLRQLVVSQPRQLSVSPYKEDLSDSSLTVDLAGLGGASATPLTPVPRELGSTSPQAAPSRRAVRRETGAHREASALLGDHLYLKSAPPHFRAAMLRQMVRAADLGLDLRHLGRALDRVVDHAARDAHCELVRLALQQAWADQRGGSCAECGGELRSLVTHNFGCSVPWNGETDPGETPAAIKAAISASLEAARSARAAVTAHERADGPDGTVDPLRVFLRRRPRGTVPDWTEASDAELLDWLSAALAETIASQPPASRLRILHRAWLAWRPKVPATRRDVLDVAAAQLRQHLERFDRQHVAARSVGSVS